METYVFGVFSVGSCGSSSLKTGLLFDLGLRTVLVEELEELGGGVLVEGVGELRDSGGNLQALVENDLLALKTDVFWPLDEAGEVGGGADVLAYSHHDVIDAVIDPSQRNIPIPKFLGVDSKRGFFAAFLDLLAPNGAAAGFLPDPALALGGWSLRRG